MSAAVSALSLNAKINLPALLEPLNFSYIRLSISSLCSGSGVPLLKLINIDGANPFIILFKW